MTSYISFQLPGLRLGSAAFAAAVAIPSPGEAARISRKGNNKVCLKKD